ASPPPPLPCAPDDPVPPDRRDTAPPSLSAAARLSATVPRPCFPLLPLSLQSWSRSCTHLYRASRGTPTKKSQALSGAPEKFISRQGHWREVEGSRECVFLPCGFREFSPERQFDRRRAERIPLCNCSSYASSNTRLNRCRDRARRKLPTAAWHRTIPR